MDRAEKNVLLGYPLVLSADPHFPNYERHRHSTWKSRSRNLDPSDSTTHLHDPHGYVLYRHLLVYHESSSQQAIVGSNERDQSKSDLNRARHWSDVNHFIVRCFQGAQYPGWELGISLLGNTHHYSCFSVPPFARVEGRVGILDRLETYAGSLV